MKDLKLVTIKEAREKQVNFSSLINEALQRNGFDIKNNSYSRMHTVTVEGLNSDEFRDRSDFVKAINSEDFGFSKIQEPAIDKTVSGSIEDLKSGFKVFFERLEAKLVTSFVFGFASETGLARMGDETAPIFYNLMGGMQNMVKMCASFAKLAIDLTKDIRPKETDSEELWQEYGKKVSGIFRNSFSTIKELAKIPFDAYMKFLSRYDFYHDDLRGDRNGMYPVDKEDFEINKSKIILPKAEFLLDFINSIIRNPKLKDSKDEGARDMFDRIAKGCAGFDIKLPSVSLKDGKVNPPMHAIDLCLDWIARIYEKTLFANLNKLKAGELV